MVGIASGTHMPTYNLAGIIPITAIAGTPISMAASMLESLDSMFCEETLHVQHSGYNYRL